MMSYKVLLVGESCRGKTEWIKGFSHSPTLGVEVHPITLPSGKLVKVWDTAGDERYKGLAQGYHHNAQGAIIFANSEEEAERWKERVRGVKTVVVGEFPGALSKRDYDQASLLELAC